MQINPEISQKKDTDTGKLIELSEKKDINGIIARFKILPEETIVNFIAELLKGNGWIVSLVRQPYKNIYILLSYPQKPHVISLILKYKNTSNPLNFEDTRKELIKFEKEPASRYRCSQFMLISPTGFEKKAIQLKQFNLLLSDRKYIEEMVMNYDISNIKEPKIHLYSHNRNTYEKVKNLWKTSKTIAVVQATGTGKSYLISKILSDFKGKNKLVMAPSHYILKQLEGYIRWETESTLFLTYAKGMFLTEAEIRSMDPDLIVLDEFHRCGAEEWGLGVNNILKAYPDAHLFGTSATPIRYMDNSRDMSEELFNGTVAENLNLAQAIVRRILPMPKYITSLYTLEEEVSELKEKVKQSKRSVTGKKIHMDEIDILKVNWERSSGVPQILKKHFTPDMNKFIVFCMNEEHLGEMEELVRGWFKKAGFDKPIKTYRVLNAESESDRNLERFIADDSEDHLHLLFSINMLNEGLHIEEVQGVILLRPTESPNIFYRQIGRCLKVNLDQPPVIFDLVNNFRNIRSKDFLGDLEFFRRQEVKKREESGLEDICPHFTVTDEVREITEVFGEISFKLDNWEIMFEQLLEYKKRFGDCSVPQKWKENKQLANWVSLQRRTYNKDILSDERIRNLEELGFEWEPLDIRWDEKFNMLVLYKKKYGNCNDPDKWKENKNLGHWVSNQRHNYKKGILSEEKIGRLEKIGFKWDLKDKNEEYWQSNFNALIKYKKKYGNCNVSVKSEKNKQLGIWVRVQRTNYKNGILSEKKIKRLEGTGFVWEPFNKKWNEKYNLLTTYKGKYGDCNVPIMRKENKQLYIWCSTQRESYKNGTLSKEKINRLEEIGFEWRLREKIDKKSWNNKYKALKKYKDLYGDCNVPRNRKEESKLASWVHNQRENYKKGILSEERIKKLEETGFEWSRIKK